jgi:glycosyltransferase involved in cell wall biosynthesis
VNGAPEISIVCPVYHEADNVLPLLSAIDANVKTPFEILFVYDIDDDPTVPAVNAAVEAYSFPIGLIRNRFGRGALNAIRTGFLSAHCTLVLVTMADLSDDYTAVDRMYGLASDGDADLVCGSRYMRGGRQIGGPKLKGTLSRIAGVSLYYLRGVPTHDATNSFKMYRKSFLESVSIESDGGFEVAIELVVKAFIAGRTIRETPSTWLDRSAGRSRFKLVRWLPKYLRWYAYAFRRRRQRRFYSRT